MDANQLLFYLRGVFETNSEATPFVWDLCRGAVLTADPVDVLRIREQALQENMYVHAERDAARSRAAELAKPPCGCQGQQAVAPGNPILHK